MCGTPPEPRTPPARAACAAAAGIAVAIGCWAWAASASAQTPPTPAPTATAPTAPQVLVELDVPDTDRLRAALGEALAAQFAGVDARLVTRPGDAGPTGAADRLRAGRRAASEQGAVALFWIEGPAGGPWLIVMMDPRSERILAREVGGDASGQPGSRAATVEATALIVAHATGALLRGEPVVLSMRATPAAPAPLPPSTAKPAPKPTPRATPTPAPPPRPSPAPTPSPTPTPEPSPAPEPGPAPQKPPPAAPASQLSLELGYQMRLVAPQLGYHQGALLELGYQPRGSLRLHVLVAGFPAATPDTQPNFRLARTALGVGAGFATAAGPLQLRFGATALLEGMHRSTRESPGFTSQPDDTRLIFGVEPLFGASLPLSPGGQLRLNLRLGAEFILNNFEYVARDGEDRVVLAPRRLQPSMLLGLALRL